MIRYTGQSFDEPPRIAVISNDNLGNFVVTTPLLAALHRQWSPSHLGYWGGTRTMELAERHDRIHSARPLFGVDWRETAATIAAHDPFDWVINLESTGPAMAAAALLSGPKTYVTGPCWSRELRGELPYAQDERGNLAEDRAWVAPDLVERYPFLRSGFIAEIFCRLAYLDGEVPAYELPRAEPKRGVPDVLIAMSASLPEKLWPVEKWIRVVAELHRAGLATGLLGAKPSNQGRFWRGSEDEARLLEATATEDLRGLWTLPQVVGALAEARAVLTLDNGILHMAVAAGTPTVGLYREGIHRLWAPPTPLLQVVTHDPGTSVAAIDEAEVLGAIHRAL